MKLDKKVTKREKGSVAQGPFVAIGSRGVTSPPLEDGFPSEMELNAWNPLPPKIQQGSDNPEVPLYRRTHSWVQSRRNGENGGKFFLGTLDYALKNKMVVPVEGVTLERKLEQGDEKLPATYRNYPRTAKGTALFPKNWKPGMKYPKMVGFVPAPGSKWAGGRIEFTMVPDGRNNFVVGKLTLPEGLLPKAAKKDEDKGGKNDKKGKDTKKDKGNGAPKKDKAKASKPAPQNEEKEEPADKELVKA